MNGTLPASIYHRGGGRSALTVSAVLLGVCVVALALGFAASTGSLLLLMPFLGLFALVLVLSVPLVWSMWALWLAAFLITGPAIYFGGVESARWLAPGLASVMLLPYLLHVTRGASPFAGKVGMAAPLVCYGLFLAVLAFGTAISEPRFGEVVLSTRVYLAYVPVVLVFAAGLIAPDHQRRIWLSALALTVAQVPVALYQAFLVAPERLNQSVAWDAVTGTFPGNPEAGGANAAVSLFVLIASLAALSLYRARQIKGLYVVAVCLSALTVVLVGEVKAIAFLIPVGLCMLYLREILRRPHIAVAGFMTSLVIGASVMAVYSYKYSVERAHLAIYAEVPITPWESIANQLDPERAQRGRDAGRVFALVDWADRNAKPSRVAELLVGHGAGSTQYGRLGVGTVAESLPYRADISATGLLLWDSGLVGHLFIVAMLVAAARLAVVAMRANSVPVVHRALLHVTAVALLLHLLCLPYKDFMLRTPPSQLLMFFLVGYAVYWFRVARMAGARKVSVGL